MAASEDKLLLSFEGGTLRLRGLGEHGVSDSGGELHPALVWDERVAAHRAPAVAYASVVLWLRARGVEYTDEARAYRTLELPQVARQTPFPYQSEALAAWQAHDHRGVVVLPTGSGKTFVATLAIDRRPRSTLVVAPTLDLVHQWYDRLHAAFAQPIGIVGGGYHEVRDLTVTTYDSAHIHMDRLGNRFGLVVFDEVHHLPGESYALAARACLAPFRLGLTATPERTDGGDGLYDELIGPIVYRKDIDELSGAYLADYETQRIEVELTREERDEYQRARGEYLAFLRKHNIRMSSLTGWNDFIVRSSRSDEGRSAFAAYRRQRQLALAAERKLDVL